MKDIKISASLLYGLLGFAFGKMLYDHTHCRRGKRRLRVSRKVRRDASGNKEIIITLKKEKGIKK